MQPARKILAGKQNTISWAKTKAMLTEHRLAWETSFLKIEKRLRDSVKTIGVISV